MFCLATESGAVPFDDATHPIAVQMMSRSRLRILQQCFFGHDVSEG